MNSKQNTRKHHYFLSSYIPNSKERRTVVACLIVTICLFFIGILLISFNHPQFMIQGDEYYKDIMESLGSASMVLYFAVFAIYPIFLLLKWKRLKMIKWRHFQLKSSLQFLGVLTRKWHVSLALAATGSASLHGYLAFITDFKWDFTNVTGILASIFLFFLLFTGLKRFKRNDKKQHFKLALVFLILLIFHASFD
ncbi:hypothetical protein QYG89_15180 [Bacillus sp. B190/17]|uniref:Uncharacterized protein n=1 Tax=Bacillus lumedeiriae TaxID=3058829 RepID=A0ABW8IBW4_9BACI